MRKASAWILGALVLACAHAWGAEEFFQEIKGDHFIVYHRGDAPFAQDVLRAAEGYYQSIAQNLGYDRFDKFWTWEHRVKIYLFGGREEYLINTQAAGWSEGFANYEKKWIVGYRTAEGFLDHVLPHEIAHLIFRDFVGMHKNIPLWLDEGVALNQEEGKPKELFDTASRAVEKGNFLPLQTVVQVQSERSLSAAMVPLFYAEAAVTVSYLLETYRRDKLVDFCKNLRDGYGMEESLRRTYQQEGIQSLEDLERKLKEFMHK